MIYGPGARKTQLLTLGSGESAGLTLNQSSNVWRVQVVALLIPKGTPNHHADADPQEL